MHGDKTRHKLQILKRRPSQSPLHPSIVYPIATSAVILLLSAAATLLLVRPPREDSAGRGNSRTSIRIGYAVEAPYAFVAEGGRVSGESPGIALYVAKALGIEEIEWRRMEFGSLINGLESGQIDVIAAGMFVTPDRAERVCFSEPTFRVREGFLVRAGNPSDLHSYRQAAESSRVRIAVLGGSVEEAFLRGLGVPPERLIHVPDARTGRLAVLSGLADGLALSSPTVRWMAAQDASHLTEAAYPFHDSSEATPGYGAFAFRKSDKQLRDAWNQVLASFIGTEEHLALVAPLGFTREDIPTEERGQGSSP